MAIPMPMLMPILLTHLNAFLYEVTTVKETIEPLSQTYQFSSLVQIADLDRPHNQPTPAAGMPGSRPLSRMGYFRTGSVHRALHAVGLSPRLPLSRFLSASGELNDF